MRNSPTALRLLKSAMNAVEDGQSGLQQLGGDATMLFYNSEEGNEVSMVFLSVGMVWCGIMMVPIKIDCSGLALAFELALEALPSAKHGYGAACSFPYAVPITHYLLHSVGEAWCSCLMRMM